MGTSLAPMTSQNPNKGIESKMATITPGTSRPVMHSATPWVWVNAKYLEKAASGPRAVSSFSFVQGELLCYIQPFWLHNVIIFATMKRLFTSSSID